eukprot:gene8643-34091_t
MPPFIPPVRDPGSSPHSAPRAPVLNLRSMNLIESLLCEEIALSFLSGFEVAKGTQAYGLELSLRKALACPEVLLQKCRSSSTSEAENKALGRVSPSACVKQSPPVDFNTFMHDLVPSVVAFSHKISTTEAELENFLKLQYSTLVSRKENECEHLRDVIRELSVSRIDAMRSKVVTMESFCELRDEYERCHKASRIAQETSRANFGKAVSYHNQLKSIQDALHKEKSSNYALSKQVVELHKENFKLCSRLSALEAVQEEELGFPCYERSIGSPVLSRVSVLY